MPSPDVADGGCVYSWGGSGAARGWHGRSGGAGPARRLTGQLVQSNNRVIQLAASRNSLALLASDGRVLSWGLNDSRGGGDAWFVRGGHVASIPDSGQLGRFAALDGARQAREAPAVLAGELTSEGAVSIASGRYHALAVGRHSRAVYSWGLNDHGQLGRAAWAGRSASRPCNQGSRCRDGLPLPVVDVTSPSPSGWVGVRASSRMPAAATVAAGRYFSVAVAIDGTAFAWGRCGCGRLTAAAALPPLPGRSGEVVRGQTAAADGDWLAALRPYAMRGGGLEHEHVVAAAVGYAHLMLLTREGSLFTCASGDDGYGGRLQRAPPPNMFGELGRDGEPLVPMRIAPSALGTWPLRSIAAGRCASFSVDAEGALRAWGCAQGSGHAVPDKREPAPLVALQGRRVHQIAAGEYHALAALVDDATLTWGAGAGGATPRTVNGLPPHAALYVAAGYQHSLVVMPCTAPPLNEWE